MKWNSGSIKAARSEDNYCLFSASDYSYFINKKVIIILQ